jgi:hypothetical protein
MAGETNEQIARREAAMLEAVTGKKLTVQVIEAKWCDHCHTAFAVEFARCPDCDRPPGS